VIEKMAALVGIEPPPQCHLISALRNSGQLQHPWLMNAM
jgi:hypothetical protein